MSGIHFRSNTLVLGLSLAALLGAGTLAVGCSSDSESGVGNEAGQSSGGAAQGQSGADSSGAGEPAVAEGGGPGETPEPSAAGQGGAPTVPAGGSAGLVEVGGRAESGGSSGVATTPGSAGDASEAGAGGQAVVEDPDAAAKERALTLITGLAASTRCTTCHQANYSGLGFWPNITPDAVNGIGTWTDDQIKAAIRDGIKADGSTLCGTMERYPFDAQQLSDLVVYLRSIAASSKKITAKCPN